MTVNFKVLDADSAKHLLVVEYTFGKRKMVVNVGYPEDDSKLEQHIQDSVPEALTVVRVPTRKMKEVIGMTGEFQSKAPPHNRTTFRLEKM